MKVAHREPRKRRSFLSCTITDGYSEASRLETESICNVKVSFWRQKKGRAWDTLLDCSPGRKVRERKQQHDFSQKLWNFSHKRKLEPLFFETWHNPIRNTLPKRISLIRIVVGWECLFKVVGAKSRDPQNAAKIPPANQLDICGCTNWGI
jgi:hypothetical protein